MSKFSLTQWHMFTIAAVCVLLLGLAGPHILVLLILIALASLSTYIPVSLLGGGLIVIVVVLMGKTWRIGYKQNVN